MIDTPPKDSFGNVRRVERYLHSINTAMNSAVEDGTSLVCLIQNSYRQIRRKRISKRPDGIRAINYYHSFIFYHLWQNVFPQSEQ
jgi:hypothetical protein